MAPPKNLRHHRFHWVRERSRFEPWEWKFSQWWRPGAAEGQAPEEAAEWGWAYVGPAVPPVQEVA